MKSRSPPGFRLACWLCVPACQGALKARLLAGGAGLDGELRDAEDALRRRNACAAEFVHLPLLSAQAAANCRLLTKCRRLRYN